MLGAIGLDAVQEITYRELVGHGAADSAHLAGRLAQPEKDVLQALHGLERQGLITRSAERPDCWVSAPPAVALGPLLSQQRHELECAELAAARLAEEYRPEAVAPGVHDLIEVVTGAQAVSQRFSQLQLGAERELCLLIRSQPLAVSAEENTAEVLAMSRGVKYRVVIGREKFPGRDGEAGDLSGLAESLGRGMEVRVVDEVPTKLVIADGALGMLPLSTPTTEPAALVARSSGLLVSLVALFEQVWRQGLPLTLGRGSDEVEETPLPGPEPIDLQILSLLLAGLTDVTVAKELDLGARTVQRRIKRLMDLSGATSRLHLGWYASEHGWITRTHG
ncbi:helix-turn-helix transcriptional regulator [Streptomyces sp. NPDC060035]|uniref:helix-turn-helix transcriptional regulator n=1 Tax=Streptomyces sp. NPDC060035 TaxID=3347044 RepID=UPI00368F170E